jgi:hypothetical protein
MDLIGFSLQIAGDVLVGRIADLAKGQIREIFGPEIEQEVTVIVTENLSKFGYQDSTIKELISKVLDEIKRLATHDPNLIIPPREILPPVEGNVDREVEKRITRLNTIINQRRAELGLPVDEGDKGHKGNPQAENFEVPPKPDTKQQDHEEPPNPDGWIDIDKEPPKKGRWATKLEESRRRIERIRAGVDISDDE